MAQYAIAFDLDTAAMRNDGLVQTNITHIYQTEILQALRSCGFTKHPQGSLYHTEAESDPIQPIMKLQNTLQSQAPNFRKYVSRVHVFRMEEWSDITNLIANHPAAGTPNASEEIAEQDDIYLSAQS